MITPDPSLIQIVRDAFPDAKVALGVGVTDLDAPLVVTIASGTVLPMGEVGRAVRGATWLVNITVLHRDRTVAYETCYDVTQTIASAIDSGEIPDISGWKYTMLPRAVEHTLSSQSHKAVTASIQLWGYYGRT